MSPAATERVPRKTEKIVELWESGSVKTKYSRFVGPQFWMGPEIDVVPELIAETTEFFATGES